VRLHAAGEPHLTYCTNIHTGESWAQVRRNVEELVTEVKRAIAPGVPFGVGLRLSAEAAMDLGRAPELDAFKASLAERGLYVFTINGFPYGTFHGARVKESVYLPDWLDDARLAYTTALGEILASLLPAHVAFGTVSTVPGAFKERVSSDGDARDMGDRILRAAAAFHGIRARTGKTIALALEPEPACHLETVDETVAFFQRHLFGREAVRRFASLTGASVAQADEAIHRHLGVCFDACHMAVEFEEPSDALVHLASAGIAIGKIQISAGLEVDLASPESLAWVGRFAEDVYLHQVVERRHGRALRRYVDLPEALAGTRTAGGPGLWRVHFHVPVFRAELGPLRGTQAYLRELLARVRAEAVSPHLEVETYTWDVLPEEHRRDGVLADIGRELRWVRDELEEAS
jgi:sugar phosphate isomerase/epimerase